MPVYRKNLYLLTPYKLISHRNEVFRALIDQEKRKDAQSKCF